MRPGGPMLGVVAIYHLLTITQIEAGDPLRCNGIDNGCCTAGNPCVEGDGDCDSDSHCEGDLICGSDNCPWGDRDDCCKKVPSYKKQRCNGIDNGCCTAENPCVEGDGDCDSDSHCEGDLTCGSNNCPWGDGDDCCLDKARIQRDLIKRYKNTYLGLKNDGSDEYRNTVMKILPELLKADALDGNEVGVAYIVNHEDTVHSLLKGQNIILKKTKNESVTINGTVNGYVNTKRSYEHMRERPTGFHAAPGDIVTITIPEHLVGKLKAHIGHKHYSDFKISYTLRESVGKIASPWGGPIILEMTEKNAIKGEFTIQLDHATRAPAFVYGKDTNELWNKEIKNYAPKWATLRLPGQLDIYVQTLKIKNITDMEETLSNIKKTMDVLEAMLGLPPNSQPGAEVLIFSHWLGGGGFHWGACVGGGPTVTSDMFYTEPIDTTDGDYDYYDDFFSINPLKGKGTNGCILHEFGHGFCYHDLPGMGAQWTAEFVREYVERTRGSPEDLQSRESKFDYPFNILYRMVSFSKFSNGRACGTASFPDSSKTSYKVDSYDNCYTYLYRLPLFEFGWNIFKEVLSTDATLTKSYSSKTDRMADLYCTATKSNLIPLFNFYNIEVSESIAEPCKKQKMPVLITKYIEIANCIKNKDIMKCTKIPGFPEHKGICTLDGTCSLSPDYKDSMWMNNEFDLWGGTSDGRWKGGFRNTAQVEENCLGRAEEMFRWCGNSETEPITATFTSKDGISKSTWKYPEVNMCTGDYEANGRPASGTKCVEVDKKVCFHKAGKWGKSYCYTDTDKSNWGASCVKCS